MMTIIDDIRSAFGLSQEGIAATVQLEAVTCCACGTVFAVEADFLKGLRKGGKNFFCPNGHSMTFGESQLDKLKRELAQEAKKRERLESQFRDAQAEIRKQERSKQALRGVITRTKRELASGRCPVCGARFEALQAHMQAEHPDYAAEEGDLLS